MNIFGDNRIVMTLDAGGTNFVFSAIKSGKEIVGPIRYPSHGNDLRICLQTIQDGFHEIGSKLPDPAVAISFAFPGPANYPAGIIGDLTNLPAFRGGVALGPMLKEQFSIPVFINNDGDLFTYGEALAGILPDINKKLIASGSEQQYKNLIGLTLGTGFGGGIVRNNELYICDKQHSLLVNYGPPKPGTYGIAAKPAASAAHDATTTARRASARSASQPQNVGAKMRASCGIASTVAISVGCSPRPAR